MYKKLLTVLVVFLTVILTGCGNTSVTESKGSAAMNYTFTRDDRALSKAGNYVICQVYDPDQINEKIHAKCIGQLITLFGEDELTDNYECLYSYGICAKDANGEELFLIVSGNSPVIIGEDDEIHNRAASELAEMIRSAEPADFEHECIYEDIPVRIKYYVRGGKPGADSDMMM